MDVMSVYQNDIFTLFLVFFLGLVLGSFLSVVSYRIPRGLSFIKGWSFCDVCKAKLNWYNNIPLFSYLFFLGKSRCCYKRISIRYPIIEVASAFGAVLIFYFFGDSILKFAVWYALYAISLSILVIDIEHQIIPDELNWLILLLVICFMPYSLQFVLYNNLFSGFFISLLLLLLHLITQGRGMGLGDVKLAMGLGVWLGLLDGLKWLLVSFILGGIVATGLLLLKKANLKTKIAFGPFLIIGFWLIIFLK